MGTRSGKVIPQLLESLKQEKFFSLVPPKSTGRELFNLPWLEARLNGEKPEDVQRTLVSLYCRNRHGCDSQFCAARQRAESLRRRRQESSDD